MSLDDITFQPEHVHENEMRCFRVNELLKQEKYNTSENRKFGRWACKQLTHSRMLKPLFYELRSETNLDKRKRLIKLFLKIDKRGLLPKYKKQWDEITNERIIMFQDF